MDTRTLRHRRLRSFCLAPPTTENPGPDRPPQPTGASGGATDLAPSSSSSTGDRTTTTILIVEDSEDLRQSTADILCLQGYGVIEAADGIEGLQKLRDEDVDILILDLALPLLDGVGVLDALTEPPLIIVVSAFQYYNEQAVRDRFGSKVFAYLRKPVPPQLLLDVVADAASGLSRRGT